MPDIFIRFDVDGNMHLFECCGDKLYYSVVVVVDEASMYNSKELIYIGIEAMSQSNIIFSINEQVEDYYKIGKDRLTVDQESIYKDINSVFFNWTKHHVMQPIDFAVLKLSKLYNFIINEYNVRVETSTIIYTSQEQPLQSNHQTNNLSSKSLDTPLASEMPSIVIKK